MSYSTIKTIRVFHKLIQRKVKVLNYYRQKHFMNNLTYNDIKEYKSAQDIIQNYDDKMDEITTKNINIYTEKSINWVKIIISKDRTFFNSVDSKLLDIWIKQNIKSQYFINYEPGLSLTIAYIEDKNEALKFKLRWGNNASV